MLHGFQIAGAKSIPDYLRDEMWKATQRSLAGFPGDQGPGTPIPPIPPGGPQGPREGPPGAAPGGPGQVPVTPTESAPPGGLPPTGGAPQAPVPPGRFSPRPQFDLPPTGRWKDVDTIEIQRVREQMQAHLQDPNLSPVDRRFIESQLDNIRDVLIGRGVEKPSAIPEQKPVEGGIQRGPGAGDEGQGQPVGPREPELQQPAKPEETVSPPPTKVEEPPFELTPPGELPVTPKEPVPLPLTRQQLEAQGQLPFDFEKQEDVSKLSNEEILRRMKEAKRKKREQEAQRARAEGTDFELTAPGELPPPAEEPGPAPVTRADLEQEGQLPLDLEKPGALPQPKIEAPPTEGGGGELPVAPKGVTYFRSGVRKAPADFEGFARAGVPVGVTAHGMSPELEQKVIDYSNSGGKIFVDSGALGKFMGTPEMQNLNFNKVLDTYQRIANHGTPARLWFVAPDAVGDPKETTELQQKHWDAIKRLQRRGANIIVPLQVSDTPLAQQMLNTVGLLFGGDKKGVVFGIPFNKEAYTAEQVAGAVKHYKERFGESPRIHLLGIGERNRNFADSIRTIRAADPDVEISADSNRIKAMTGKGRVLTEEAGRRAKEGEREPIDDHP